MSHAALSREERERRGITGGLVRLSVGLETAADLMVDIRQALDRAAQAGEGVGSAASPRPAQGDSHGQDL
jgi:hypothetical protein